MRILILEDEPPIASFIKNNCLEILGNLISNIHVCHTADDAVEYLRHHAIDLCLLDLNLSGDDGFDFLKQVVSMPFQTIVISAYSDRAIKAYEMGVIDFVAKPFDRERLQLALDRYMGRHSGHSKLKYLVYRLNRDFKMLEVKDISYFKSERIIVKAFTNEERPVLLDKHLNQLERILPANFIRIHRSYIINSEFIDSFGRKENGSAFVRLNTDEELPVSRSRIIPLKKLLDN